MSVRLRVWRIVLLVAGLLALAGLPAMMGCNVNGGGSGTPEPAPSDTPDVAPAPQPTPATDDFETTYGFSEGMLMLPTDLHDRLLSSPDSYQVIDLRNFGDYIAEHIAEAVSIPGGKQFELRVREVDPMKTIVLVSNSRYENVARAIEVLVGAGYNPKTILVLQGGLQAWMDVPYPVDVDPDIPC